MAFPAQSTRGSFDNHRIDTVAARLLGVAAFAASLLVRLYRLPDSHFARDQGVSLWMALDAVRIGFIPDHGLVSSFLALQPPGLTWLMMPAVLAGRGDPLAVMVWFSVLASIGIGALVWTIAQMNSLRLAGILAGLLVTNPADALAPGLLWHVSLFLGLMSLFLAAAIRLRSGASRWWGVALAAAPLLMAFIHFSGVLVLPFVYLLVPPGRLRNASLAIACGSMLGLAAWLPFLVFEATRGWQDVAIVLSAVSPGSADRLDGLKTTIEDWGTGRWVEPGRISIIVWLAGVAGLVYSFIRNNNNNNNKSNSNNRKLGRLAGTVLVWGTVLQAVVGMGHRQDITSLWNVPFLVLAALAIERIPIRMLAYGLLIVVISGNLYIFSRERDRSVVRGDTLAQNWARAQLGEAWQRSAEDRARTPPEASRYIAGDPPVVAGTGSEVWYLREVMQAGAGRRAAAKDAEAQE